MLNLTDAERARVIADIESLIEWRIPKGGYTNGKSEIDICKSLLLAIQWDTFPGKDEQEELEEMLEDFLTKYQNNIRLVPGEQSGFVVDLERKSLKTFIDELEGVIADINELIEK